MIRAIGWALVLTGLGAFWGAVTWLLMGAGFPQMLIAALLGAASGATVGRIVSDPFARPGGDVMSVALRRRAEAAATCGRCYGDDRAECIRVGRCLGDARFVERGPFNIDGWELPPFNIDGWELRPLRPEEKDQPHG